MYFIPCYSVSIVKFEHVNAGYLNFVKKIECTLTNFMPLVYFYILENYFLMLSRGIEIEQWHEMC